MSLWLEEIQVTSAQIASHPTNWFFRLYAPSYSSNNSRHIFLLGSIVVTGKMEAHIKGGELMDAEILNGEE